MSDAPLQTGEAIPGLPPGERVLWQGAPEWFQLAVTALHVRKVALYFAFLLGLRLFEEPSLLAHFSFLLVSGVGLALLLLLARLMARSTRYAITDRRVVMRFGVALPMTINLPFSAVKAVDLRLRGQHRGDIVIRPDFNRKLSFAIMWPHARPWRLAPVEPMLRCVPNARRVAEVLVDALADASTESARLAAQTETYDEPREEPVPLPPLLGAAALVLITLVSVAWVRLADPVDQPRSIADVSASVQLRFEDRPDGSVFIIDAATGQRLDALEPGSHNFLRAAVRSLVRERGRDRAERQPFDLLWTSTGQLLLVDPVTMNQIDLWAFGETNARTFARLKPHAAKQQSDTDPVPIASTIGPNALDGGPDRQDALR